MSAIIREERIGGQRQSTREAFCVLRLHVAGLAQSDEVGPNVSFLGCVKEAEWSNVMHGQAAADVLSAHVAAPTLLGHNRLSSQKPASAPVGSRPPYPVRRIRPARLGRATALNPAKPCRPIAAGLPRLLPELFGAVLTGSKVAVRPLGVVAALDVFGGEGVGRPFPRPELVALQVRLGRGIEERFRLPRRPATSRAKSGRFLTVRPNGKCDGASLTGHCNHVNMIHRTLPLGNRTTLIACKRVDEATRQPDLFVAPVAQPQQESLL